MRKKRSYLFIIILQIIVLFILTAIIAHYGWDIKLARVFFDHSSSSWFQKDLPIWRISYHYGTLPAILLSLVALIGLILSFIKPKFKQNQIYFIFILLTMVIGPGLLVNGIFKDHWGRPRPRQVQEFGGRWEFKEIWQQGIPGKGKSFPCGHCSMGFFFIVLYYSYKKRNKIVAYSGLVTSLALGTTIGFARIAQGGHFLSDVLWSCGLTYLSATILYYIVLKIPQRESSKKISTPDKIKKRSKIMVVSVYSGVILSISLGIFLFVFSKPVYKEYKHHLPMETSEAAFPKKLVAEINRGDIEITLGKYEFPVLIAVKIHGFGFPISKMKSKLRKQVKQDTLNINYILNVNGLFNEIDILTKIYVDSSLIIPVSAITSNGNISLFNFQKKQSLIKFMSAPKGKIFYDLK